MLPSVVCVAVLAMVAGTGEPLPAGTGVFRLRILHNNDMHSRFEQISQLSGKCSDYEAENNKCYGGFARVLTAAREERRKAGAEGVPVLFLNAGDTYQGTTYYSVYKWQIVARFLDMLGIDAMSLGNHEFDDGVEGLVPFLHNVSVPVVTANLGLDAEPTLAAAPLAPSLVVEVGGRRVGIVGYLTPETKTLANTGRVEIFDEVTSIAAEARRLRDQGVTIIVAVGHSGYDADLRIARETELVDVVVGGHTNTFLYTGTPPDIEVPAASYPVLVKQKSGRKVAVVQAFAYTKYLGVLDAVFDEGGELVEASGNPLLLDHTVQQDQAVLDELDLWRGGMDNITKEVIGKTRVLLDGSRCRFVECNIGNLITDAFIHYGVENFGGANWTNAPIALVQGGGIRSSINIPIRPGVVTREDVMIVMPFFNTIEVLRLQGRYLLEALEWSVARYDPAQIVGRGEFLQVSGLHVVYDVAKPVGSRVVSTRARCSQCDVPRFEPVDPAAEYNVILPSFLARGGDNYTVFPLHGTPVSLYDAFDTDIVVNFVKERYLLYDDIEGRIAFITEDTAGAGAGAAGPRGAALPALLLAALLALPLTR